VLDLPSGSKAVAPVACVTSSYPTFRTFVRNVVGAEGVFFYASYAGANSWSNPNNTGQFHGGGKTSDFQVYDAELDPRMKH
jgi:hypothetical protein